MTVRAIDPLTFDIVTQGRHQFIHNVYQVAQDINTRLGLFMGEWFRDLNEGTGWFQFILQQRSMTEPAREIKRRILQTPNVKFIVYYNATFEPKQGRRYSAQVKVTTPFSARPIEVEVSPAILTSEHNNG